MKRCARWIKNDLRIESSIFHRSKLNALLVCQVSTSLLRFEFGMWLKVVSNIQYSYHANSTSRTQTGRKTRLGILSPKSEHLVWGWVNHWFPGIGIRIDEFSPGPGIWDFGSGMFGTCRYAFVYRMEDLREERTSCEGKGKEREGRGVEDIGTVIITALQWDQKLWKIKEELSGMWVS